jgi:hypothetical protein
MKRRGRESGFAMLLVFLMAACVAITLYIEIPRVAFEAERERELLLVDRGNQFKRAIQVFVTDKINNPTHRYPASLDELETFNNHRYLRHRYVDPMTGKDEWRLVHINGGVLTDSVTTQAKPANGAAQSGSNTPATPEFISQQAYMDTGSNGAAAGGVTRALNRRPSDSQTPGAPGAPGDSSTPPPAGSQGTQANAGGTGANNGLPPLPGQPGANAPGTPPGIPGVPGSPSTGQQPPQQNCFIGDCGASTASGQPSGQPVPGGVPGMPQAGGASGFGIPGGGPASAQSNAQSAAASMIGNLLTQPRPGGMPTGMPGTTIGGGIAGVASKFEAEGIMVINQRTKINEWEYIFDQSKYRAPPNPVTGPAGTPQQQTGPGGITPNGPGGIPGGTGPGTGAPGAVPVGPGGGIGQ